MRKAVKIIIHGTVQGIFYRRFVKEEADKLGLRGFVRNLENGDVEAVVEGMDEAVDKMVEKCRAGPPHSIIKNVDIEERKWSGDFESFEILRF